jgi:hypothetical protein
MVRISFQTIGGPFTEKIGPDTAAEVCSVLRLALAARRSLRLAKMAGWPLACRKAALRTLIADKIKTEAERPVMIAQCPNHATLKTAGKAASMRLVA